MLLHKSDIHIEDDWAVALEGVAFRKLSSPDHHCWLSVFPVTGDWLRAIIRLRGISQTGRGADELLRLHRGHQFVDRLSLYEAIALANVVGADVAQHGELVSAGLDPIGTASWNLPLFPPSIGQKLSQDQTLLFQSCRTSVAPVFWWDRSPEWANSYYHYQGAIKPEKPPYGREQAVLIGHPSFDRVGPAKPDKEAQPPARFRLAIRNAGA